MTLLELCEPLFQYVCRINRSARKGGAHDLRVVRDEIKAIFNDMHSRSLSTPGLRDQYEKVRLALVCFVDHMVTRSRLVANAQWKTLAEEEDPPIYTYDEVFFDPELRDAMDDRSEAGNERLAVFYTCMGLGFLGYFEDRPQEVRNRMKEIAGRIRNTMDSDESRKICPEAYEFTNTTDLTEPPLRPLVPMAVALVGLVLVSLVLWGYLYWDGSRQLRRDVETVIDRSGVPAAVAQKK